MRAGLTLIETLVVVGLVALLAGLVSARIISRVRQAYFQDDVRRFSRSLRAAAEHAVLTGKPLVVVIEVFSGEYNIFEANADDLYDPEEVEPLLGPRILDQSYIEQVEFEDGSRQYSGQVMLRATPQGWKGTVLMTLRDLDDRAYFIRCDRLTPRVVLSHQPLEIPEPRKELSIYTPL